MKILTMFPPNYWQINAAFNVRGRPVIFCYGDTIYNPKRIKVGPDLIAHESVHSVQQDRDPAAWWQRYIDDPRFRLHEEIAAHRAEYRVSGERHEIARRLSSGLYGNLISFDQALASLEAA